MNSIEQLAKKLYEAHSAGNPFALSWEKHKAEKRPITFRHWMRLAALAETHVIHSLPKPFTVVRPKEDPADRLVVCACGARFIASDKHVCRLEKTA